MVGAGAAIASPRREKRDWRPSARNGRNYSTLCAACVRWPVPDWRQFVAGQLAQWPPESPERQEIIEELASHLEETYEHLRHRGASHSQALQGALAQVEN